MLSFGWSEIALTVVIIIIVVGPKEIPNLLRQLGIFSKSLKKISREFKNSLNDLANEEDIKDVKKSISEISKLKDKFNINKELKEEISTIQDTIQKVDKDIVEVSESFKKNK